MKKLLTLILLSYLLISCDTEPNTDTNLTVNGDEDSLIEMNSSQDESSENSSSLYPSKNGYVKFSINGTMTGEETWHWADWGKKRRMSVKTTLEIMGIVQEQNSVTIILDDKIYSVDEAAGTASLLSSELNSNMSSINYNNDDLMTQMGGVKKGKKKILGKDCQIWEVADMMTVVAIWKGLTLETKIDMGIVTTENLATEMDLNSTIDADMFDISGYEIIDLGNVEDIMNGGN